MTAQAILDGRVTILATDVRKALAILPDDSFDCVVTSPPYYGLRSYGTDPQIWDGDPNCDHQWGELQRGKRKDMLPEDKTKSIGRSGRNDWQDGAAHNGGNFCLQCGAWRGELGLEPYLGLHLDHLVEIFREVRRILKPTGTLWLNYGDCYASSPNGRSAADTKAAGNDDRTFRDKPISTVGPIQARCNNGEGQHHDRRGPVYEQDSESRQNSRGTRAQVLHDRKQSSNPLGRIVAGGYLKPKDLCMIPNRLAIALQDDGWWVRSEIIWHKPNPMPESIADRPTSSHEKIWLLTKSEKYFYDAEAIKEPTRFDSHIQSAKKGAFNGKTEAMADTGRNAFRAIVETRNIRNVWTIGTEPFSEAHFAVFPTAIADRCIKAGCPEGGKVLDPFGGSGTTGLVAATLGRTCTLIELNPEYVALARARIESAFTMGKAEGRYHLARETNKKVDLGPLFGEI